MTPKAKCLWNEESIGPAVVSSCFGSFFIPKLKGSYVVFLNCPGLVALRTFGISGRSGATCDAPGDFGGLLRGLASGCSFAPGDGGFLKSGMTPLATVSRFAPCVRLLISEAEPPNMPRISDDVLLRACRRPDLFDASKTNLCSSFCCC